MVEQPMTEQSPAVQRLREAFEKAQVAGANAFQVPEALVAADPTLAADIEMGQAFREAVEALPDDGAWWLSELCSTENGWRAYADHRDWKTPAIRGDGSTPTEALRELARALTSRLGSRE